MSLLDNVTFAAASGATALSVTVPVTLVPPWTVDGVTEKFTSCTVVDGSISSVAVAAPFGPCAVIMAFCTVDVAAVEMGNVAEVCPCATVTTDG